MANAIPVPSALVSIRSRIADAPGQRLPWAEVMRIALYEPGVGYYRQGVRRIGREGDFYTSVSAGPLFGHLLAEQARKVWVALGQPERFTVIEQGAHDGTLAKDILTGCRELDPAFAEVARYVIVEPDAGLWDAQRATLAAYGNVSWVTALDELPAIPGSALFLCNELLDAFPVHRLRLSEGVWREVWVTLDDAAASAASPSGLRFVDAEFSDARLEEWAATLSKHYPDGYTTEVCLDAAPWVAGVAAAPFTGAVLILDYGLPAVEYFSPERTDGTLRRYIRHRTDGEVLEDLGDADLTADVNFTCVAQDAEKSGLELAAFLEQGRYLTKLFADIFSSRPMPMDAASRRQFHTLTHPGILGRNFHALLLAKGLAAARITDSAEQEAALRRLGL